MSDDRIPVVVAGPPLRTGGTEQHMLYVLPVLAARGFDITLVLFERGGALEQAMADAGIHIVTPSFATPRPVRTLWQAALIRHGVRTRGARLVQAYLSEPYLAATAAGLMASAYPPVIFARRSLAFYAGGQRLGAWLERKAHARARVLLGNSMAVAEELREESGAPEKVKVIHNGIPLEGLVRDDERKAARAQFGLPQDAFVLTMVANFHPYKGHGDLIRALASIRDDLPSDWRVLLPGRDGGQGYFDDIRRMIATVGLEHHVVLPGEWKGSRAPYAAADVGVLASHTEGFSNSLIEGMAAGLPMVATAVGGNLDAVNDAETGLLVPACAPDPLGKAILGLARDPALRARLGTAAAQEAAQRFSLTACVDAYERLWRSLL